MAGQVPHTLVSGGKRMIQKSFKFGEVLFDRVFHSTDDQKLKNTIYLQSIYNDTHFSMQVIVGYKANSVYLHSIFIRTPIFRLRLKKPFD